METHLVQWLRGTPEGNEAEAILRRCVHCGFCTATCPTYQLLGDERDSPRGRIYLIKAVVEGETPGPSTQMHLDRCLTCRNCETTCPSGVQYGRLVDIGRELVERQVRRPLGQRLLRGLLRETLTRPAIFGPSMRVGQMVRPILPSRLRDKVPARRPAGQWPAGDHRRRVLMPAGCVQPSMMPSIDAACARVLDRLGISVIRPARTGCCGAIRQHLSDAEGALEDARRNVAAWWPFVEQGVEAILINASGCSVMIKDYAHLLRDDPEWAERAAQVVERVRDISEWLPTELERRWTEQGLPEPDPGKVSRVAFHPPCTLQHGQQQRGSVERVLATLGAQPLPVTDAHLCCGSAGTYSVLQPELSLRLRESKLQSLQAQSPAMILSANIGCIAHLQAGTGTPVRHWVEWLDGLGEAILPKRSSPAVMADR
jgi:glycolate oxidase iron-sulfur subunit